jgi:hypothetical protein
VPCHRVIGADGSLTGFGGGLPRKQWLLEHGRKVSAATDATVPPLPLGRASAAASSLPAHTKRGTIPAFSAQTQHGGRDKNPQHSAGKTMARLYLINPSAMKLVYTNDQAVGNGCPNRRDDVLLVQFFLKVISDGPGKGDFTPTGRGPLSIDGLWGPISQAFLNQYIAVNSAENPTSPLTRDGRVDPVVNGRVSGSRSGHVYTILALNNTYKNVRGPAALQDITIDSLFPQELRPSIQIRNQ